MNAINRQKFLAELAKLLSFMYEEDRRYALDMYERMFNIAGEDEQWLIQNLMSPTRQAVIIARSYDAKERSLTVSAHWKEEDGYEDESEETPPFVLAINKIFDDLFPVEEESGKGAEEQNNDQASFFDEEETESRARKKNKPPTAAVLLSSTQEFSSITKKTEEAILFEFPEKEEQENEWNDEPEASYDGADEDNDAVSEPDPRVNLIDRADAFSLTEEKSAEEAPDETDKSTAGEPESEPQSPEKVKKKRRSIEDLLGFRKERTEEKEQNIPEKTAVSTVTAPLTENAAAGEEPATETEQVFTPEIEQDAKPEAEQVAEPKTEAHDALASGAGPAGPKMEETTLNPEIPVEEGRKRQSSKAVPLIEEETHEPVKQTEEPMSAELPAIEEHPTENQPVVQERWEPVHPEAAVFELPEEKEPVIRKPEPREKRNGKPATRRVLNVPILVLFLIPAIPITLAVLILLALLAALCLGLSLSLIAFGCVLILSAFSGFAVMADIMLLLGAALISLALGLLLFWMVFWIVGSMMVDTVTRVRELAEKWCYKEVPAA